MKNFAKKYAFLTVFLLLVISHGCGGGTSGTTNINGNVGSVTARGNFAGITVLIEEDTKFSTITNDSGIFELLNIPSGNPVTLAFILNNKTARISLETPSNTTITLKNISLNFSTGVASVSQLISNPNDDNTENNNNNSGSSGTTAATNSTTGGQTTGSNLTGTTTGDEVAGSNTTETTGGSTTETTGGSTTETTGGSTTETTGGETTGGETTGGDTEGLTGTGLATDETSTDTSDTNDTE